MTNLSTDQEVAAVIPIKTLKGVIPMDNKLKFIGPMLFFKFSILMAIIVSLTLVIPMSIAAHKGAQEICSFIMNTDACTKHC